MVSSSPTRINAGFVSGGNGVGSQKGSSVNAELWQRA